MSSSFCHFTSRRFQPFSIGNTGSYLCQGRLEARRLSFRGRSHHNYDLTLERLGLCPFDQFTQRTPRDLLVEFRQFTGNSSDAILTKNFYNRFKCISSSLISLIDKQSPS